MLYREVGQFKTSYAADQAVFPILQDRIGVLAIVAIAFVLVPLVASDFVLNSVLIPVLVLSLAAIGLNLLTGYTGLLSLGTGGFMGVGAFACYKLTTYFPGTNIILLILACGFASAAVGTVFGLPSLRIKGFYLAVATLAAQFFLSWCFIRVQWLYNYNISASIEVPTRSVFGIPITGPTATPATRYLVVLAIVTVMTWLASNLVRGRIGRMWMAVRDMDIAAELIGIRPMQTKLLAFAISSFYCGVAGAMLLNLYLNSVETQAFAINVSFDVLFMVIIGGLASIMGSFLGAGFIVLMPILLTNFLPSVGLPLDTATQKHIEQMLFGGLMIFFLIVEPHGFARLWQIGKEKLRLWPFPH